MSQTPDIGARPYLIRKGAYWYRPHCSGYTDSAISAGRYTLEEAELYSHPNGKDGPRDGMSICHEDDLTSPDWLKYAALRSEVTDLQNTVTRLTRELGAARDAEAAAIVDCENCGFVPEKTD